MRSIRLSLMVYFLLLVSAGLGVASLLVYTLAQRTLRDKEEAFGKLIEARYEERRREAETRLDERLLAQAKTLAGRVRWQGRWHWAHLGPNADPTKRYFHLHGLGLLTACLSPNGTVLTGWWWVQGAQWRREVSGGEPGRRAPAMHHPVQSFLWRHEMLELSLSQEVAVQEDLEGPRIHSLIETNHWGSPLRASGDLQLPSEADFEPKLRVTWEKDNCVLAGGVPVRRLRFRARMNMDLFPQPFGRPPPRPGGDHRDRDPTGPAPAAIIIQCAANMRELDDVLAGARTQRDAESDQLRAETVAALQFQRNWLLVIIGSTFGATILGCVGLVWLGLSPVRKLSDAVSQINPKNFTLALGDKPLPVELQPIAERLKETLDQLRRAFTREKQATADISHELRTPLAALLTTIELALRKPRSAEQYRELLQESLQSAQQMHQIVERLLTLARLDAGVDRLRARNVDVADLAEQCATAVRPLAEARGLRVLVHNECPETKLNESLAAQIHTDPDKLREILSNLLHNAIQYNRPDGHIDLVVARHNGHVRVEVRDTGIGISPESRDRIFERFYRVDPSRSNDGMNAGLGLAIVKEYIELMGGQIRVESTLGKGSTFRVELPTQAPASAA